MGRRSSSPLTVIVLSDWVTNSSASRAFFTSVIYMTARSCAWLREPCRVLWKIQAQLCRYLDIAAFHIAAITSGSRQKSFLDVCWAVKTVVVSARAVMEYLCTIGPCQAARAPMI